MDWYYSLTVATEEEAVLGLLSQFDFESFEERDGELVAYISDRLCSESFRQEVEETLQPFAVQYRWEKMPPQNWNELWEASFQPVQVDTFCRVRAQFHPFDPSVQYDLVIQPKMAFGTGHHATTYMMMQWMRETDMTGKRVFDFGCGTGVLAVLACKMGASLVDAVDIEEESYRNTLENADENEVRCIQAYCGSLEDVPFVKYDVVLANINRNILQKYASDLRNRMSQQATIIWSGVLEEDIDSVVSTFTTHGLQVKGKLVRQGWGAVAMELS